MYEEQGLTLKMILPGWMSPDDFYTFAAGGAAFLAVFAVGSALMEGDGKARKRIRQLQERRAEMRGQLVKSRKRKRPEGSVNLMRQVVNKFKLLKSSQVAQVQTLLIEAGFRSKDAIVIYMFFSLVMPIVGLVLGLSFAGLYGGEGKMAKFMRLLAPILCLYIGYKITYWFVAKKRKKRYLKVKRALSDTLDLMTICAEAGLTLGISLERVSRELGLAYPEMAEELSITSMELGFLPERNKALQNLAERVQLQEVRGIVSVLIQTEKYGTPIAQALRVLSHEFREQRMLAAENKAARLPALLTLPMILFILPTLFIIIMTPAVLKVGASMN